MSKKVQNYRKNLLFMFLSIQKKGEIKYENNKTIPKI